ncbi:MAG: hypothetical protein ABIE68_04990 [bacterium]
MTNAAFTVNTNPIINGSHIPNNIPRITQGHKILAELRRLLEEADEFDLLD